MPASYDPTIALIVVDVQNDFADPEGGLSVRGGGDVVPLINKEIEAARAAGATVIFTQDWHPASTPHFAKDGGTWPVHCVAGSWGADLPPGLDALEADPRVRKGSDGEDGYSGFTMRDPATGATTPTDLDGLLTRSGITRTRIAGLATDYCVRATALDSVALGYLTDVLVDAIRAGDLVPGDGGRALDEMRAAGVTMVVSQAASTPGVPTEGGA